LVIDVVVVEEFDVVVVVGQQKREAIYDRRTS
jgi:hypothetical protein